MHVRNYGMREGLYLDNKIIQGEYSDKIIKWIFWSTVHSIQHNWTVNISSGKLSANYRNRSLVHSWESPICEKVHKNVYPVHGLKTDVKYATNIYSGTGGIELGKMPWLLYPRGPLYRILEGPHNWTECDRKEKISCSFQESSARLVNVWQKYRDFCFLSGLHVSVSYVFEHRKSVNYTVL